MMKLKFEQRVLIDQKDAIKLKCSMPGSVVPLATFISVHGNVKESTLNSNSRQHCMGHRLEPAGPENSPWLETGW